VKCSGRGVCARGRNGFELVDAKCAKIMKKCCNHRVRVCGCRWGPPRLKKILLFFYPFFRDFWKLICRGGSISSRPYKSICSHPFIGATGKTAPTEGYQPPLKNVFYVVNLIYIYVPIYVRIYIYIYIITINVSPSYPHISIQTSKLSAYTSAIINED